MVVLGLSNTEQLCMLMFNVMGYLAYYLLLYTVYDLNPSNLITLGCLNKICFNRDSLKQLNRNQALLCNYMVNRIHVY